MAPAASLFIYFVCACVQKRGEGEGGWRFLRDRRPPRSCPCPRCSRYRPQDCPRAVGAIVTLHIQPPDSATRARGRGRQDRGPPPAGCFGNIYLFSPIAQRVTAGAPGADRRGSKCSGSMSFGVRGGRRGPRIKAHPINLNFGSAWPAVRGPAGGERVVGAGKATTPPAAGTSQRRGGGGVCVWRCDKASPR